MATVWVSVFILAVGLANLLIGMDVLGSTKPGGNKKAWMKAHRIVGYVFVVLFIPVFVGMSGRLAHGSLSSKATMHAVLGFCAFVILASKVLVARRFKRFSDRMFTLGLTLFVMTFALIMFMAAGPVMRLFAQDKAEQVAASEPVKAAAAETKMMDAEKLLIAKCTACHELGRTIYAIREYKTVDDWKKVIDRMRQKTGAIDEKDRDALADYLAQLAAQ